MRHSKKRKTSHRRRSRRSRIGAVDLKKTGTRILGVAAGAFLARTVNNMAAKQFPTLSPKILGIGDVAIGVFVPKFLKSEIGQGIGDAFIAIGSLTTLQSFGVLSGMGAMPSRVPSRVIGAGGQPFVSKMVGATGRPYMKKTVGGMGSAYSRMETMNRQAMGAAHGLGALAIEE
jgi:hypothetical protein